MTVGIQKKHSNLLSIYCLLVLGKLFVKRQGCFLVFRQFLDVSGFHKRSRRHSKTTKSQAVLSHMFKKVQELKNRFQPEKKLFKTFLNVTRTITDMLYYTENPYTWWNHPDCKHLPSKMTLSFCIFSENCDKLRLLKTTKYFQFILPDIADCSDTFLRDRRPSLESISLPISWQLIVISNEINRRDENTKMLAKRQIWRSTSNWK